MDFKATYCTYVGMKRQAIYTSEVVGGETNDMGYGKCWNCVASEDPRRRLVGCQEDKVGCPPLCFPKVYQCLPNIHWRTKVVVPDVEYDVHFTSLPSLGWLLINAWMIFSNTLNPLEETYVFYAFF